jgi:hypothetical protein
MFRMTMMAAVAAITLSTATAYAQSASTPSLGEVARRTAAQWAKGKKATKVFTNASLDVLPEEVATVSPASPPVATAGTPATPAAAGTTAATAKDEKAPADSISKDENHWRNQAATVRADLARAKATLDKQQAGTPQHEQAQRLVTLFEKRWDALVEAAKTANVPPEWVGSR